MRYSTGHSRACLGRLHLRTLKSVPQNWQGQRMEVVRPSSHLSTALLKTKASACCALTCRDR